MAKASDAKPTEALVKPGSTAMARPAFLNNDPIEGFEGMDQADVTIARLALAQSMTGVAKKANPDYVEGLEEGLFFNSLTKEVYGKKVRFIPLFFFKNR